MGVVYKLKQEVIDFIISQKKADSDLSCRRLVDIVKLKFNLALSKSSVNEIIKDTGLSKPVGRRRVAFAVSSVKEQIRPLSPEERAEFLPKPDEKKPLLEKKEKPSPAIRLPDDAPKKPTPPIELPDKPAVPMAPVAAIPEQIKPEDKVPTAPVAKQEESLSIKIERLEPQTGKVYDGLGAYLLKAAELELTDAPILAKLLSAYIPREYQNGLEFISDIMLYAPAFGIDSLWQVPGYKKEGLWVFVGNKKLIQGSLASYMKYLQSQKGLSLALRNQSTGLFQEVKYLKIILKDATELCIDSRFKGIWIKPSQIGHLFTTSYKIDSYIDKVFNQARQFLILLSGDEERALTKPTVDFVLACEGVADKKITKIELYDTEDQKIPKEMNVHSEKRSFILGFWPWQREGVELTKHALQARNRIYSEALSRDIYYAEGEMEIEQTIVDKRVMLRYALLQDAPMTPARMGIFTNIPKEEKPMNEVIKSFLERWPNLEESYLAVKKASISAVGADSKPPQASQGLDASKADFQGDLNWLRDQLSAYARRHFFGPGYKEADFSLMKERFYSLPGGIKRGEGKLMITLLTPKGYAFYQDLFYATKRINESDIKDSSGARLFINIKTAS